MKNMVSYRNLAAALLLGWLPAFAPQASAQWGMPLWTNRYNGPGNSSDNAQAVAVDNTGNVFVAGYAYVGGLSYNYGTVAYSGTGVPLWTNLYTGGHGDDEATAIATDGAGNVFVTGQSMGGLGNYDFATVAYSGAGTPLWTNRFNPGPSYAVPSAVATDSSGNVFVTGYAFNNDGSGSYYSTLAYSSAGVSLWNNRFKGPGTLGDAATALAVDADGNVLVTGISDGGQGNMDYATVKYSNPGLALWTNRFSGPTNGDDKAYALAVDHSGNAFVTGKSVGIKGSYEYATVAYSAGGSPLWTNRYAGPGGVDEAARIAVDSSGDVFVTGTSLGADGYNDAATVAYSGAGLALWTNRYPRIKGKAIAVDRNRNVFVTGSDYVTVAYSGTGVLLWTNQYLGFGHGGIVNALVLDGSDNLFVTGADAAANFANDYGTVKYAATVFPSLFRQQISNQLVLTWSNSLFTLQTASTATGIFTKVSGATSPYTNSATDFQRFFRLALY